MRFGRLVVIAITAVFFVSIAQAETIGIGTSPPGSLSYSIGAAAAKLITEKVGIQARVQPHSGNNAYIPAVNAGEIDFANINRKEMDEALNGAGIFKGQKLSNLRVTHVMNVLVTAWFVAKDSPINSIGDLKGKKIPGKWSTQRSIQFNTEAQLANAGLSYDDMEVLPVASVSRGADDFIQGRVDAFFFAVGSGKTRQAGAKVGGLKVLGLDTSPAALARFQEKLLGGYPLLLEPSKENYGIIKPTYVSALDSYYVTNKDVPDELVYQVVKAFYGGKESLVKSFKPLSTFDPNRMAIKLPGATYHPGAIKFYKEIGLWPPK